MWGSNLSPYQRASAASYCVAVGDSQRSPPSCRDPATLMAKLARTEMGVDKLTAVADRGYYKSEEILACHETGVTVFVPNTVTSSATAHARFSTDDFFTTRNQTNIAFPPATRFSA